MRDVVVLDSGTHSTKAGFSGESVPRLITPTVVGHRSGESYVGNEVLLRRGKVQVSQPIRQGKIHDWDDLLQVWQQVLEVELRVDPSVHPVLLTESPEEHVRNRERKAELFFETLQVPQFSLATQSVLALHAEGYTSGVVVDVGAGNSAVVPILEGKLIPYALDWICGNGNDLTCQLMKTLETHGLRQDLNTHWDIANHIKETMCFVPDKNSQVSEGVYTLPDSSQITLTPYQRSLPLSLLSGPHSVLSSFSSSLSRLDPDLGETLSGQVVLAGGTTDCPGFGEHLFEKLGKEARMVDPSREGRIRAWVGGSVVASLSSFERMSVMKTEYEESGSGLINRRCTMDSGSESFYGLYGFRGS